MPVRTSRDREDGSWVGTNTNGRAWSARSCAYPPCAAMNKENADCCQDGFVCLDRAVLGTAKYDQRRFCLGSRGDAEGLGALGDFGAGACRLMQASNTSAYSRPRSSEALDAPGSAAAGVLPGETPGVVVRTEVPEMVSASSWHSAGSECALGKSMTDTLKPITTQNVRSLGATNKFIIGSRPHYARTIKRPGTTPGRSGRSLRPDAERPASVHSGGPTC